jgi:DNA-binding response OmpR family regulator
MMLTARDTPYDKISGLDAGADDCVVKPADVVELLTRVRALGRRSPLWSGNSLRVADLTVHLSTLTVERENRSQRLSTREFQLLKYFMRHPQQVVSRSQIEQALWQDLRS